MDSDDQDSQKLNSLLDWITKLLNVASPLNTDPIPTVKDFKDGILLGKILKNIIDPAFFHDINYSSSTEFTTLIEIKDKMLKYVETKTGYKISSNLAPNTIKIISNSNNLHEICRLLQLLLICAVHCPMQKIYFDDILKILDDQVKIDIMECVTEMMMNNVSNVMDLREEGEEFSQRNFNKSSEVNRYSNFNKGSQAHNARVSEDNAREEKIEELYQENQDLNSKLRQLTHENESLILRNQHLQFSLESSVTEDEYIKEQNELKQRIDRLREESFGLGGIVDEYESKNKNLQSQLVEAHSKISSNSQMFQELLDAKEEIISLREKASKVDKLQVIINKLNDALDVAETNKNIIKRHQARNEELNTKIHHLETELIKVTVYKNQIEELKKQLSVAQDELSQESEKAKKSQIEHQQLYERFKNVQEAIRKLQDDKIHLQGRLDEIQAVEDEKKDEYNNGGGGGYRFGRRSSNIFDEMETSFSNSPLKEKFVNLQMENTKLQESLAAQDEAFSSNEASKILVQQLRQREVELLEQIYEKDQENTELKSYYENQLQALKSAKVGPVEKVEIFGTYYSTVFRKNSDEINLQRDSEEHLLNLKSSPSSTIVSSLENSYNQMQEERGGQILQVEEGVKEVNASDPPPFVATESEIIRPKQLSVAELSEIPILESKTSHQKKIIPKVQRYGDLTEDLSDINLTNTNNNQEIERIRAAYEMEEKLLSSAFYNYGLTLHRLAVEERNSSTLTLLQKQRSISTNNYNGKSVSNTATASRATTPLHLQTGVNPSSNRNRRIL